MQLTQSLTDRPTTSWQIARESFHPNGKEHKSQTVSPGSWTLKVPQADEGIFGEGKQFVRSSLMRNLSGDIPLSKATQRMNLWCKVCRFSRAFLGTGPQ